MGTSSKCTKKISIVTISFIHLVIHMIDTGINTPFNRQNGS